MYSLWAELKLTWRRTLLQIFSEPRIQEANLEAGTNFLTLRQARNSLWTD